jgi:hypothetical protein
MDSASAVELAVARQRVQEGADLLVRGAAATELGGNVRGKDAGFLQGGVVLGDKRIVGIVGGDALGEPCAEQVSDRDPSGSGTIGRRVSSRHSHDQPPSDRYPGAEHAELSSTKNGLAGPRRTHLGWVLMRGYGQFCPVAKACEIVAEWEMFRWQTRRGEGSRDRAIWSWRSRAGSP